MKPSIKIVSASKPCSLLVGLTAAYVKGMRGVSYYPPTLHVCALLFCIQFHL